jgi:stearoyl-CoA desaturase (delta-9 desaturase)
LTAFYHRYFAHRAFKTTRWFQFAGAFLANAAAQRGPLWWAAHHREHHRHSDKAGDVHSPHVHGFWWSHMGWFMERGNFAKGRDGVKDLAKYPELRFLDRFDLVAPVTLAVAMFGLGTLLERYFPAWNTSGWQMLVWAFLVSTIALYHVTYAVNSLAHVWGTRRYPTSDESRNNWWIALATFGEGWHNNHHYYPSSARQGFYWWEIDMTYCILRMLSWVGIVWDLREVPPHVLQEGRGAAKHV